MNRVVLLWCGLGAIVIAQGETELKPVTTAPIQYYQKQCARCHGDNGSNYGDELGAHRKDSRLVSDVDRMARGPGGKPLSGTDLDAQVAFHRALILKQPFLVWTFRSGKLLKGEVSDGAKVTARQMGKSVKVRQSGTNWAIEPNSDAELRITASKGRSSTILDLSQAAFSHSSPLIR